MRRVKSMFVLGLLNVALVGCSKNDKKNEEGKPADTSTATKPADMSTATKPADTPTATKSDDAKPAGDTMSAGEETDPAVAPTDGAEPGADKTAALDHSDWSTFFGDFQKAAAARDSEALAALTHIGNEIDQGTFDMLGDTFLTKEVLDELASADATAIKPTDESGTQIYEFSWSETAMVDGEEMGSGLFFYFKKVDGKYKLFRLLAAG